MKKQRAKIHKNEDGQALIMVVLAIVVLMGIAALVVDVGILYVEKANMQKAADAAALAGAKDLPNGATAKNTAESYAKANGAESVYPITPYNGDSNKIEVVSKKKVSFAFARVLGFTDTNVSAQAVAQKSGSAGGISGLRPWALKDNYTYGYGVEFVLKEGGGGGSQGYYGIIGFSDQNANSGSVYKENIADGYDGIIKIGDKVSKGSGNVNVKRVIRTLMNKSGDTIGDYTKATKGNSRVVLVPKISIESQKVIGFAAIYLKSVDNQGYITANFLYDTTWPDGDRASYEDWDLNSHTRLIE